MDCLLSCGFRNFHEIRLHGSIQAFSVGEQVALTLPKPSLSERRCTLVLTNDEYGPNGGTKYLDGGKNNLSHYSRLMPHAIFGQAGGALRTGRWLVHPFKSDGTGTHHTQMLVGILNALGIPDQTFGDPSAMQGPLPKLLG
jgi:hypothetical protein